MVLGPIIDLVTKNEVLQDLDAELQRAGKDVVRYGGDALRRSLRAGERDAERILKEKWNRIDKMIEKLVYTRKFNRKNLTGRVAVSGRKVAIRDFMTTQEMRRQYDLGLNRGRSVARSKGVTANVYKGRPPTTYPGRFIAKMKNGHMNVFKRTGDARFPIKVQYAKEDLNYPFIQNIAKFEQKAAATFAAELNVELEKEFE